MTAPVRELTDALLEGDHAAAASLVKGFLESENRFNLYNRLITPSMYEIGQRWQRNEISVADEHLATAVCDFVLSQSEHELVRYSRHDSSGPKAMFFTVEDEHHYLGMKMVSILFREKNWNVKYYQDNLPAVHIISEIERWKPDVIGLSFSLVHRVEGLTAYLKRFSELSYKPEILVGGRLINLYDFSSVGQPNTTFINDLSELQKWFKKTTLNGRDNENGEQDSTSII